MNDIKLSSALAFSAALLAATSAHGQNYQQQTSLSGPCPTAPASYAVQPPQSLVANDTGYFKPQNASTLSCSQTNQHVSFKLSDFRNANPLDDRLTTSISASSFTFNGQPNALSGVNLGLEEILNVNKFTVSVGIQNDELSRYQRMLYSLEVNKGLALEESLGPLNIKAGNNIANSNAFLFASAYLTKYTSFNFSGVSSTKNDLLFAGPQGNKMDNSGAQAGFTYDRGPLRAGLIGGTAARGFLQLKLTVLLGK